MFEQFGCCECGHPYLSEKDVGVPCLNWWEYIFVIHAESV